jgi:hypothetical protein
MEKYLEQGDDFVSAVKSITGLKIHRDFVPSDL